MLNFQDCKKSGELKRSLQYFISLADLWNNVIGRHRKLLGKRICIQILENLGEVEKTLLDVYVQNETPCHVVLYSQEN